MHWSDQVGEAALGVRGHPVESYNDVYYPRKGDADGSFPVYENSSQQLLFRDERNYPFVWVLSFSLAPDNLEEPATWYAQLALPHKSRIWLTWTTAIAPSPSADDGSVPLGRSAWSRKDHAVGIEVIALATAEAQQEHCASTLCLSLYHDGVCTQRIRRVAGQWQWSRQKKRRRLPLHRLLRKRSCGMFRPWRSLG